MAKSVAYNPQSDEITSPPIASMSEAISYVTDVLNMKTASETDIPLTEVYIEEKDRFRIFQAPEGKRVWVASPAPVVRKNGTVVSGYQIAGGGIVFDSNQADGDGFTVDCTYIVGGSEMLDNLIAKSDKSILASVSLPAANWTEDAVNGYWTQPITHSAIVDGTSLTISFGTQDLKQIFADGVSIMAENNNGIATAYSYENVPSADLTMQIEIRQVKEQ